MKKKTTKKETKKTIKKNGKLKTTIKKTANKKVTKKATPKKKKEAVVLKTEDQNVTKIYHRIGATSFCKYCGRPYEMADIKDDPGCCGSKACMAKAKQDYSVGWTNISDNFSVLETKKSKDKK